MAEGIRGRRRLAAAGVVAAAAAGGVLGAAALEGRGEVARQDRRPAPETWHWVLPAQHDGVEVVELHPGDCYVLRQVDGIVYFGEPPPGVLELQERLGDPIVHRVEEVGDHPECRREECIALSRLTRAIVDRLVEAGDRRAMRRADHRPSPLDDMRGGAYTDVGSAERPRYRQTREQRMAYLHLQTAARDNCYAAQVPRTLTIHVRDRQHRPDRTGFYSGYLYVEHHHAPVPGRVAGRPRRGTARMPEPPVGRQAESHGGVFPTGRLRLGAARTPGRPVGPAAAPPGAGEQVGNELVLEEANDR